MMEDYYQLNSTKIQNALSNFKPISKEYQLNLNASAEYLMDNQLQQLIDTDDLIPHFHRESPTGRNVFLYEANTIGKSPFSIK